MATKTILPVGIALLAAGLSACEREVSFANDVQPLLESRCIQCHSSQGEGVMASGFSVQDYDSIVRGTKFGQVVVPGSAMSSALYLVVAEKTAPEIRMPPHHDEALAEGRGRPLSEDEIAVIETWINQGAKNN